MRMRCTFLSNMPKQENKNSYIITHRQIHKNSLSLHNLNARSILELSIKNKKPVKSTWITKYFDLESALQLKTDAMNVSSQNLQTLHIKVLQ